MTGKNVFKILKPFFILLTKTAKIIPLFIISLFWSLLVPFEGKVSCGLRYVLLSRLCKSCGDNVYIGKNVTLKNTFNLVIGSNVSIHANCYIDASGGIDIGDNVSIAHNSSIISFEHTWDNLQVPIKYNPTRLDKIIICEDIWIGCGVRVLAGSKVNTRVIVAAGSVVKGELDEKSIYAGVPCRKIKDL